MNQCPRSDLLLTTIMHIPRNTAREIRLELFHWYTYRRLSGIGWVRTRTRELGVPTSIPSPFSPPYLINTALRRTLYNVSGGEMWRGPLIHKMCANDNQPETYQPLLNRWTGVNQYRCVSGRAWTPYSLQQESTWIVACLFCAVQGVIVKHYK